MQFGKTQLEELLGPPRHVSDSAERKPEVGVVTGLAWTPVGGDIMFIETRTYPGKGDVKLTGQMGDVMKESAQAAFSWTRSNATRLGIDHDKLSSLDLHIHLPQGAIKKDGPSAGVALTCAVVSVFTNRPIRNDVAITGEIDLRGHALPVGGIKEKVIAAHRAGIKIVFLPERNKKDTLDIPDEVKNELDLRLHEQDRRRAPGRPRRRPADAGPRAGDPAAHRAHRPRLRRRAPALVTSAGELAAASDSAAQEFHRRSACPRSSTAASFARAAASAGPAQIVVRGRSSRRRSGWRTGDPRR